MEKTIQILDSDRQQFQQHRLSGTELAMLSHREISRFEARALEALEAGAGGADQARHVFQTDAMMRDLRGWFDEYRSGKITLQVLIRKMVHEHSTVTAFLEDPDLGYHAFTGFSGK